MNGPRVINGKIDPNALAEFLGLDKPTPAIDEAPPLATHADEGFGNLQRKSEKLALKEALEFNPRNNHVLIRALMEQFRVIVQEKRDLIRRVERLENIVAESRPGMRV